MLELFYASGLRLSELVGLDLEDLHLGERMVRVLGKGGKERLLPFNRSTEEALRRWLPDREQVRRLVPAAPSRAAGRRAWARRAPPAGGVSTGLAANRCS